MRFGIQIETQFGFTYDDVKTIARDAERSGFEALWVCDHFFLNATSVNTNCLEAWALLAALTQVTTTLRLGTLVSCQSYRNPALLAKTAASLDHMSGGRMEFGIGAGWKEIEYRAYGYEFPAPRVRVDQLIDTIEIAKRMWTEDKATYHGKHYRIDDAQCAPKPVQKPMPMWIAGEKPRLMRIVAKYGDAVNVGGFPTPERYAEVMRDLEAACRKIGRDHKTILRSHFTFALIGETQAKVDAMVAEHASRAKLSPQDWLARRAHAPVGTPEQVIEKLRPYQALGVDYLVPVFPFGTERESARLFGERVIPAMR